MRITTLITAFSLSIVFNVCHADQKAGEAAFETRQFDVAYRELKPAAESGNMNAQYLLGSLYQNGNGIGKDSKEAAAWYLKAARGGHPDAQLALADMYRTGKGIDTDEGLADYWQWRASYTMASQAKGLLISEYNHPSGPGGEADAQPAPTKATIKHCVKPDYPEEAMRSHQQGKVTIFFIVGPDGKVIDLHVIQSSGWPLLDAASTDGFKSCTFVPATLKGAPVESVFAMSYNWTLRRP